MLFVDDFQFFDREADFTISAGDLPHWQQPGATYFITYRTIDSISPIAMERIIAERNDWLKRNGIDPALSGWHLMHRNLSDTQRQSFHRHFSMSFERELDCLEGECLLRKPALASLVAKSLRHVDGQRYRLGGFIVMPNHVHVLARVFPEYEMLRQCFSWKHFQAHAINLAEARQGHFFQPESFDHLVRDAEYLDQFRRYIEENPKKANLREGEFQLYLPDISWESRAAR